MVGVGVNWPHSSNGDKVIFFLFLEPKKIDLFSK